MSLPGERERAGGGGRRAGAQGAQPQPGQGNNLIVEDPDPGSGAFLAPGSGIRFRDGEKVRIRDPE